MKITVPKNRFFKRFANEEDGSWSLEIIILTPAMFFALLFVYDAFYGFRMNSVNQKVAFTISDMVSRETTPIDDAYVSGSLELFKFMTAAHNNNASIRITAVKYDGENDKFELEWSEGRGNIIGATPAEVENWKDRLPNMPDNEIITVVETYVDFEPVFNIGFEDRLIYNFVFTRPRYAPQVLYDNGTGT